MTKVSKPRVTLSKAKIYRVIKRRLIKQNGENPSEDPKIWPLPSFLVLNSRADSEKTIAAFQEMAALYNYYQQAQYSTCRYTL